MRFLLLLFSVSCVNCLPLERAHISVMLVFHLYPFHFIPYNMELKSWACYQALSFRRRNIHNEYTRIYRRKRTKCVLFIVSVIFSIDWSKIEEFSLFLLFCHYFVGITLNESQCWICFWDYDQIAFMQVNHPHNYTTNKAQMILKTIADQKMN